MPIFPTFFKFNIGQENDFYDILERKNAFLGPKNTKFKKSKNWHFSKGVKPCFCSKYGHFSNLFIRQYKLGKCLYDILEQKNAFLGSKNKKFKKSKNNPWFWSKYGQFSNLFFFKQNRLGKCLLRYSRTKKRLSRL